MSHINIEFKARKENIKELEQKLLEQNPRYIGEDFQTDTYYMVSHGRLKLREGNIENALIWYERENLAGSKQSNVILYPHPPSQLLKEILEKVHSIKAIVKKKRRIYFLGNIKFHFDEVENLGTFIEVEAIDKDGTINRGKLQEQCNDYIGYFNILPGEFIEKSYSDLIMELS